MAQHKLLPPLLQFMRWFSAKTRSVYSSQLDIHLTYHCVSLSRYASRETMFHLSTTAITKLSILLWNDDNRLNLCILKTAINCLATWHLDIPHTKTWPKNVSKGGKSVLIYSVRLYWPLQKLMERMQERFESVRDEIKLVVRSELGLTSFSTTRDLNHLTISARIAQPWQHK